MIEVVKVGDAARIDVRFLLSKECIVEDLVVVVVSELVWVPKRPPAYKISDPLPIIAHFKGLFSLHTSFATCISKAFFQCILSLR